MRPGYLINFMFIFTTSVQAMDTQLLFYKPFDPIHAHGNTIQHHKGECYLPSEKTERVDAWKCHHQQEEIDPCFIKQYGNHKEALCPKSPWGNEHIYIDLDTPVSSSRKKDALDFSRSFPWALKLSQGETCLAIKPGKMFDNMPIHYECEQGGQLFGPLQRCQRPWTIMKQEKGVTTTATVVVAWF